MQNDRPDSFRVIGDIAGANGIMHNARFLGTYPGLTNQMLDRKIAVIRDFVLSAVAS